MSGMKMEAAPPIAVAPSAPVATTAPVAPNDPVAPAAVPVDAPPQQRGMPECQANIVNRASDFNPEPTAVPAPQKQFFGTLGVRHVICMVGLPVRGRNYVASELGWYLEFFHGSEVRLFDVAEFASSSGDASREQHAEDLLTAVNSFMQAQSTADEGKVAIIIPFRMSSTERDRNLLERSRKSWQHIWSCSNAMDREWVRERVTRTTWKLMFVELEVTDAALRQQQLDNLQPESRTAFIAAEAEHRRAYTPLGRSASTEGALSFLRLKNFRDMETNRMHGYMRMRISQFLSVLRPWKHAIYLSRHGESTCVLSRSFHMHPRCPFPPPLGDAWTGCVRACHVW